jgi:LPS export ABC transporter permease LptG
MRLLDRYVLTNFLLPFFYCFFGFLAIWLVFDLTDNGPDFIDNKVPLLRIAKFYGTQFPQIIVISLPIGLLLALLYSLSRMSRSNEIISMLTAGRSLSRIVLPLFAAGLLVTAASLALNYKLAPHSDAQKKKLLYQMTHSKDEQQEQDTILFKNRTDNRTWYVQRIDVKRNHLEGIEIIQQNKAEDIVRKYYAKSAEFDPATKTWSLEKGKLVNFDPQGNVTTEEMWLNGAKSVSSWSETPWRIASSELDPQDLSVPELNDYLNFNSDFPDAGLAPYRTHLGYRWALPWQCFIVVLIAAPLGIVYSRRGVLGGVLLSMVLFFCLMFLSNLGLALGKWNHISPFTATWGPDLVFAAIGLLLLYARSNNREFPSPKNWFKRKAH